MHTYKISRYIISACLMMFAFLQGNTVMAQSKDKGLAGLEIVQTHTQEVLGTNVGFSVEIQNNNKLAFDAIEYTVTYYDGFDEKMGEKQFKWQPSTTGKSIETGKSLKDYHANWIKGANKISVVITRVHFTNGTIVNAKKK